MPLTPAIVSAGAVATGGTLGTAAAPAFGQNTTAHNLVVAHVKATRGTSGGNFTCSDGTWTRAVQDVSRGQVQTSVWYKADCGATETAPTFNYSNSALIHAQLREFSGCKRVSPLDRTAGANGAGSVVNSPDITATCAGADTASPTVVVTADAFSFNSNYTHASGDTYNNGATPTGPNNDAVSNRDHYRFGYGITTGNSGADTQQATSDQVGTASVASTCIATFKAALSISANPGSVAITGAAATLKRARFMSASPGAMAITGAAATLIRALKMTATPGSIAITGAAATRGWRLVATAGSVAITGASATLVRALNLSATAGAVAITGAAATLARALKLTASAGAVAITGADAVLSIGRKLSAAPGSVVITGAAAARSIGVTFQADPGVIVITADDVSVARTWHLLAAAGAVAIDGADAVLSQGIHTSLLPGTVVITGYLATGQAFILIEGTPRTGLLTRPDRGFLTEPVMGRITKART